MLEYTNYWTHKRGAVVASRVVSIQERKEGGTNIVLDDGSEIETGSNYQTLLGRLTTILGGKDEDKG